MTGDRGDERATTGTDREPWLRDLSSDSPLAEASRLHDLATRRQTDRRSTPDANTPVSPAPADETASPLIAAIRRAAALNDLQLAGSPTDYRYGRVVDVRARMDGRACDLQLRLFRQPGKDPDGFEDALADQLDRWAAVSDLDGVVPIVDAAGSPRPWAATAPIGATLADSVPDSLVGALRTARSLARTLVAVHDRGVCHTGLDPAHVVTAPGTDRPLLNGVGLFDVYRRYGEPANALSLPYAAPEYFDDRYGVADRTTDVYGLGALCYRIFTGRDPYEGSPADVREAVLTDPFPRPSAVVDVPEAVDDIVARATATDKFDRYQSVAAFAEDLEELCLWLLDEE